MRKTLCPDPKKNDAPLCDTARCDPGRPMTAPPTLHLPEDPDLLRGRIADLTAERDLLRSSLAQVLRGPEDGFGGQAAASATRRATAAPQVFGSVTIPCLKSDLPQLEKVFALWSLPRFLPKTHPDGDRPILLVVFNDAEIEVIQQTKILFTRYKRLSACFSGIEVVSAGLQGDRDIYVRGSRTSRGAFGNKAGPNFLFQSAMHFSSRYGFYTFQMELDCLPLRAGWLDEISDLLENQTAWVIGSPYLGTRGLGKSIQFHINGNALYRSGSEEFLRFVDDVWMNRLLLQSQSLPNLAYDCWWSVEMSNSNSASGNEAWKLWQEFCFRFVYHPLVVNLVVTARDCPDYLEARDRLERQGQSPLFFHGQVMAKVIAFLHDNRDWSVEEALAAVAAQAAAGPYEAAADDQGQRKPAPFPAMFSADAPPTATKIILADGFYAVEGPSDRFFPIRYVWTSSREFSFVPITVSGDIELVFRDIKGRSFAGSGMPSFAVEQKGIALDCTTEVLDPPMFCRLRIRLPQDAAFDRVRISTSATLLDGSRGAGLSQGLLLFEHGFQIIEP